jgi:hypothetical protein
MSWTEMQCCDRLIVTQSPCCTSIVDVSVLGSFKEPNDYPLQAAEFYSILCNAPKSEAKLHHLIAA